MADPRPPTREELARVFKEPRTLKAFERIFDFVPGEFEVAEVASVISKAADGAAQSDLAELFKALDALHMAQPFQDLAPKLDYIDLDLYPKHAHKVGRLAWNADDDTLNIHHSGDVTQQVGLESYTRVYNGTGSTIGNGSVVAFTGASGGNVSGVKYIADGSGPVEYLIGVATQDIPDGEVGRVTTAGLVRDLDTSAFSVGDVLYASPTSAGALTNTRPSPPNYTVLVGVVVVSNATTGAILVRPIIEPSKRFAKVLKTTNQTPAATNTAYAITFDSLGLSQGFTIGSPASRIVAGSSGLYNVGASFQLTSGSSSVKNVWLWYRQNGVDVANSALKVSLESSSAVNTQFRSLFLSLAAGDYVELCWAADSTNVTLSAIASTAFAPGAPASVVTITQVQ